MAGNGKLQRPSVRRGMERESDKTRWRRRERARNKRKGRKRKREEARKGWGGEGNRGCSPFPPHPELGRRTFGCSPAEDRKEQGEGDGSRTNGYEITCPTLFLKSKQPIS